MLRGRTRARPDDRVGDATLEEVFDRHYPEVYRYLARRVPAAVAEDLASETFVQVVARRSGFDPERGVIRGWVFGIATHLLSHHYRDEERAYRAYARTGADPVLGGDPVDRAVERVDAQSSRSALVSALADLAPRDRDVLLLVAHAELTYAEVAQALDIPVGTVRSHLNRARKSVRAALESTEQSKGTTR